MLLAWEAMTAAVFAHQGGWDEILVVLMPLMLFAGLLYMARRRADQLGQDNSETRDDSTAP